jgi:hypothetical protein
MRRILPVVLALAAAALPLRAQDGANPPDPAIQGTINAQIEAFLRDDFATAFSYASPGIKGVFGTPENFGRMVRQGYPMVWRPSSVRMLELRTVAGNLWQRVLVTDAAGVSHLLDYQMVQTPDGWQINAVQLLPAPGVGA